MLSSISPFGERARATRWSVTVVAYLLGSLAGGLALGLLAAALGSLLPVAARQSPWAATVLVALITLGLLLDRGVGGRRLPSWRRQVDEGWLSGYRGWVYGVGFGTQLGFGVVTIITSATVYATVLLAAWSGDLRAGLAIGGLFGLVRALPVPLLARVHDRSGLYRVFRRLERWATPADRLAQATLAAAALVLAAVAVEGVLS